MKSIRHQIRQEMCDRVWWILMEQVNIRVRKHISVEISKSPINVNVIRGNQVMNQLLELFCK